MPYFISDLSLLPKDRPLFAQADEKGRPMNEWTLPTTTRRLGGVLGLDGFQLTQDTDPRITILEGICAVQVSRHRSLPDIFGVGGDICVSQSLTDIVEGLEPGCHQFLPIKLLRAKNDFFDGAYYILNIYQVLDAVVFEQSNLVLLGEYPGGQMFGQGFNAHNYRTIRSAAVRGKHLWRDKTHLRDIYISDNLFEFCLKKKIKGLCGSTGLICSSTGRGIPVCQKVLCI